MIPSRRLLTFLIACAALVPPQVHLSTEQSLGVLKRASAPIGFCDDQELRSLGHDGFRVVT